MREIKLEHTQSRVYISTRYPADVLKKIFQTRGTYKQRGGG